MTPNAADVISIDPKLDRLYELVPAIHRLREAEIAERLHLGASGYYLRDLLRVIAEQVNAVEENIAQLYDDWFIETCSDWVVPYIAALVGYEPVSAGGEPIDCDSAENRFLVPRRDVGDTIRFRRRRGAFSVLKDLGFAVSGWPTMPVEFFKHLGWTQNLNHQYSEGLRARVASLHDANSLEQLESPFDRFARSVDVRRISNPASSGKFNIPSVGSFVWRLRSYSWTETSANCLDAGRNAYTFSLLGNDAPLFTNPDLQSATAELQFPTPIRRRGLEKSLASYYGPEKSFALWADWADYDGEAPLPASAVVAADLSGWAYAPPNNSVAVDPALGRIAFPLNQLPRQHVKVTYHYAFSADMGGGEYERTLQQPTGAVVFSVGRAADYPNINGAIAEWQKQNPKNAVIEIEDSAVYVEQISIAVGEDQSLQLRAANGCRPAVRLLNWMTDLPDSLSVQLSRGSRFTLDGLLVTGRGVVVSGKQEAAPRARKKAIANRYENPRNEICPAEIVIRHCTLVPGWTIDECCEPLSPNKESLEIINVRAAVTIDKSIVGPIRVQEDEVRTDPIPLNISNSIVDAVGGDRPALAGPRERNEHRHAHVTLTATNSTVFGIVQPHAMQLAENTIFYDCVHVARRQIGCMRFCYVPSGCRTPKRYHCQPDLVKDAARKGVSPSVGEAAAVREAARVRPQFTQKHYGMPAYCQLAETCAPEIANGASDSSELGAFHDLFQPQRLANLRTRLEQYTPAGLLSGVVLAD